MGGCTMIKSMTGYGRAREVRNKRDITVEVRSVNNRYLDCTVKMPRMYSFAEDAVKQCVQKAISRGKVDVFVTLDNTGAEQVKVSVNRPVADGYFAALKELAGTYELPQDISVSLLSRFPDVLLAEKTEEDLEGREDQQLIRRLVAERLTPREADVIRRRYGLDGHPPQTQRQVAAAYGISRSYVSRIEKRALEKLEAALREHCYP